MQMNLPAFDVFATVAIAFLALMLFLALFEPGLRYQIKNPPAVSIGSEDFIRILGALANGTIHSNSRVEVLTNGEVFYEAELEAIGSAQHNINIEAYIFQKGKLTRRFIDALVEKARAGVQINLVADAIGSFMTWNSYFETLKAAGGRVEWYHPIRLHTLPRINNRTHRELLIVDGKVGFIGGAGFADHWLYGKRNGLRWRDTMFRVEGEAVTDLQSTFVENWLEASGEVLAGIEYFPQTAPAGRARVLVVDSSPSVGESTRARFLFQTLLASARESIYIATPYFLPDRSAREEMVRAIRDRGVKIKILTPGKKTDHLLTRTSSRRLYGPLLRAGAEIFEYLPSMMHAKVMIIDGLWSVVGSTNLDNRSFGLNDEVNLAALDTELAVRLQEDFARDLADSLAVSYDEWKRRSLFERAHEWLGWVLERQQ
ncbi:MAG TPA: phospholipase D-like domain-containing protein [Blastocatellia bacterium]|nr:phospholipase D-like domain-containing protein [Blastocatellia bacterium]